jgi:hypothetical protein
MSIRRQFTRHRETPRLFFVIQKVIFQIEFADECGYKLIVAVETTEDQKRQPAGEVLIETGMTDIH